MQVPPSFQQDNFPAGIASQHHKQPVLFRCVIRTILFLPLLPLFLKKILHPHKRTHTHTHTHTHTYTSGVSSNLLAPSYGAWLHDTTLEDGSTQTTRSPAFLTGMSVSYIATLDRVSELYMLAGDLGSVAVSFLCFLFSFLLFSHLFFFLPFFFPFPHSPLLRSASENCAAQPSPA